MISGTHTQTFLSGMFTQLFLNTHVDECVFVEGSSCISFAKSEVVKVFLSSMTCFKKKVTVQFVCIRIFTVVHHRRHATATAGKQAQ